MRDEKTLIEAEFNPTVTRYWLLSGVIILLVTIVGAPLAILWFFIGNFFCKKFLDRMSCTLTERNLIIRKGMLNRIEKTIPLEKITDLALFQGPIMRAMNLKGFKVETAGGGGAATGYLVQLIGIVDTEGFRDAVLAQRDARETPRSPAPLPASATTPSASDTLTSPEVIELLREMRDSLRAIENKG